MTSRLQPSDLIRQTPTSKLSHLFDQWSVNDQIVMGRICFDVLTTPLGKKEESDNFCGVFVEGRDRVINSYEEYAAFKSFKLFSKKNYPIFAYINKYSIDTFLDPETISEYRIKVIPIEPLNSLHEYSRYWIEKIVYDNPVSSALCFQADGFLMKSGWEDFVKDIDFIGAHWRHFAAIDVKGTNAFSWIPATPFCNGGFSFRRLDKFQYLSSHFKELEMAERGHPQQLPPPEDLFWSYFGFGLKIFDSISLKQCDLFCTDPCTLEDYISKKSFGFHRPVFKSEWLECNHL